MTDTNASLLCVKDDAGIIGVVTDRDLRKRVLAFNENGNNPISAVMTAPVKVINENALLYEAVLMCQQEQVSHLLVENNNGHIKGIV